MSTQPTISWVQYTMAPGGGLSEGSALSNNTVDYAAVQAGQYSPAICVRPVFSNNADSAIGSVRLWWSTYSAKDPNGNTISSLPENGWVLKYYVTDCETRVLGDQTSTTSSDRAYKMLSYLSTSERVAKVAGDVTFSTAPTDMTDNTGYCWCKPTWQQSATGNTYISMQPVPFSSYRDTVAQHQAQFASKYDGSTTTNKWVTTVFGRTNTTYTSGELLKWAVGGDLTGKAKCNVAEYVTPTNGFPYIFFTIKAPTTADAGTWSGWACRISYIWPYTPSTTQLTN